MWHSHESKFMLMNLIRNTCSLLKLHLAGANELTQFEWNLTLYVLNFSEWTCIYILCHSSTLIWHRYLNFFLNYDKDLHILYSQCYGCWCPGDVRSQGISNHDIDLVKPSWLGPRTSRVKICYDVIFNLILPDGTKLQHWHIIFHKITRNQLKCMFSAAMLQ